MESWIASRRSSWPDSRTSWTEAAKERKTKREFRASVGPSSPIAAVASVADRVAPAVSAVEEGTSKNRGWAMWRPAVGDAVADPDNRAHDVDVIGDAVVPFVSSGSYCGVWDYCLGGSNNDCSASGLRQRRSSWMDLPMTKPSTDPESIRFPSRRIFRQQPFLSFRWNFQEQVRKEKSPCLD